MPKFIKMGLGGTGYLGHKESALRSARKRAARRKVAEGFPRITPLSGAKELVSYFSGDRIVCLLCGRALRTLAVHIQRIHGMSDDAYKKRFGIPLGFSLSCSETTALHSEWSKHAITEGIIPVSAEQAFLARTQIAPGTKRQKSKKTMEKIVASGEKEKPAKRGSPEYHQKMRARPQCQPDVVGQRFSRYWTGRKQSPEHVRKRLKRT